MLQYQTPRISRRALSVGCALSICLADLILPVGIAASLAYIAIVWLAARSSWRGSPALAALGCTGLTILGWVCALDTDFTGADALRRVKQQGPERRLVAFVMEETAIPRQGMAISVGGEVTSGTHPPSLDVGIGLGYVPSTQATAGTELEIDVRGKPRRARVVAKPIYKKER